MSLPASQVGSPASGVSGIGGPPPSSPSSLSSSLHLPPSILTPLPPSDLVQFYTMTPSKECRYVPGEYSIHEIPDYTLNGPHCSGHPSYCELVPEEQRKVVRFIFDVPPPPPPPSTSSLPIISQVNGIELMEGLEVEQTSPVSFVPSSQLGEESKGAIWTYHINRSFSASWGVPFLFVLKMVSFMRDLVGSRKGKRGRSRLRHQAGPEKREEKLTPFCIL